MPCESCTVQFSVFKRKRACSECERYYCSACLRRGGGAMCAPCRVLSTRPLSRQTIANLKVRDIQCFLQRQNVSTRGCVEKEELVSLCISHVNSSSYRRRGTRPGASFTTFKGITTNINDFINSAFDLRNTSQSAPSPPTRGFANNCFNTGHAHGSPANNTSPSAPPYPDQERFTTRPGGEPDVVVASPESSSSVSRSSSGGPRVDTADCYEIEDLDDAGWEFVTRPADPLPNDSQLLMSTSATSESGAGMASVVGGGMSRALSVSDPELHHHPHPAGLPHEPPSPRGEHVEDADVSPKRINVEQFKSAAELEQLSVKQLKELLTRNRVEYRGCLERKDLLERAKTLWKNYAELKDEVDNLPLEECCKICMAAPLECVLLECGHIAACTLCATQLSECPICRQYVVRAVRFFRS